MKINITILAEDVKNNDYFDTESCPITRAIQRAGYVGFEDAGFNITNDEGEVLSSMKYKSYEELSDRVNGMYSTKDWKEYLNSNGKLSEPLIDFSIELEVNFLP